jgi:hypothetical protein
MDRIGAGQPPERGEGPAVWQAERLTAGGQTARILLGDQEYVLRITRAGKLILTK